MSEPASPLGSKAVSKLATERLQEMSNCAKLAKMPLQEGAMTWLQSRKPFIGARTARDYEKYICIVVRFFGNVRLEKLANPDLIRAFQLERSKTCGPTTVKFSEAGDYVLHVIANDYSGDGGGGFGCCWSTAMLKVAVK